jgi:hypothetical protein
LSDDLARLERLPKVASLNFDQIAQKLRARVNDVAGVLERQTVQARQMLRKILADKIELEPVGSGRQRGYKFRGNLSLEKLGEGEAMTNTSDGGGPNGTRSNLHNSSTRFHCTLIHLQRVLGAYFGIPRRGDAVTDLGSSSPSTCVTKSPRGSCPQALQGRRRASAAASTR